jgi:hypothetical protein
MDRIFFNTYHKVITKRYKNPQLYAAMLQVWHSLARDRSHIREKANAAVVPESRDAYIKVADAIGVMQGIVARHIHRDRGEV